MSENIQYVLHSKNKNSIIHLKKVKFDEKDRLINVIISYRFCTDYLQTQKILYLSIDQIQNKVQFWKNLNNIAIDNVNSLNIEHIKLFYYWEFQKTNN